MKESYKECFVLNDSQLHYSFQLLIRLKNQPNLSLRRHADIAVTPQGCIIGTAVVPCCEELKLCIDTTGSKQTIHCPFLGCTANF